MAIESPINPEDGWFIGEDKTLIVLVYTDKYRGSVEDISGWAMQFDLLDRRSGSSLVSKTTGGGGITIPDGTDGRAFIQIDAADTAGLNWRDRHRYVLKRTDFGSKGVIAHGAVAIRDPENA